MSSWSEYTQKRMAAWEKIATRPPHHWLARHYQRRLHTVYRQIVPPGARVLELGCSTGDLLAAVQPGYGVGVDFSEGMIAQARAYHPELKFVQADVHELVPAETFDYILLSDLINDLWDVQQVFERLRSFCHAETRILLNIYSRLWQLPLSVAQGLRLANRVLEQNWLTVPDV